MTLAEYYARRCGALPWTVPFKRNGCAPIAFAVAASMNLAGLKALACAARKQPVRIKGRWRLRTVLLGNGRAFVNQGEAFRWWLEASNLELVREITYTRTEGVPSMTIARFTRDVANAGRWIVFTKGHVQSMVHGQIFNAVRRPLTRVEFAVEVRLKEGPCT